MATRPKILLTTVVLFVALGSACSSDPVDVVSADATADAATPTTVMEGDSASPNYAVADDSSPKEQAGVDSEAPYPPPLECEGRNKGVSSLDYSAGAGVATIEEAIDRWVTDDQSVVPGWSAEDRVIAIADADGVVRTHLRLGRVAGKWVVSTVSGCVD